MFHQSDVKRAHALVEGDVLLWEGHYYVVRDSARLSPSQTLVVLIPISPALPEFDTTLQSDQNIMTFAWQ